MATTVKNEVLGVAMALAASEYALATINVAGARKLCVHVKANAQAFDAFKALGRSHENAAYVDFSPAAWASPVATARVNRTSGNLAALASGAEGYFEMDVEGLTSVQIKASAAGASATADLRYSLT